MDTVPEVPLVAGFFQWVVQMERARLLRNYFWQATFALAVVATFELYRLGYNIMLPFIICFGVTGVLYARGGPTINPTELIEEYVRSTNARHNQLISQFDNQPPFPEYHIQRAPDAVNLATTEPLYVIGGLSELSELGETGKDGVAPAVEVSEAAGVVEAAEAVEAVEAVEAAEAAGGAEAADGEAAKPVKRAKHVKRSKQAY